MAKQPLVGSIVFARAPNGRIYVLTVQRANTKTWNRQVMFGAAGRQEKTETPMQAVKREVQEELGIKPKEMLRVLNVCKAFAARPEHFGLNGKAFSVEVSMKTLQRVARAINKKPKSFEELRSARINRIHTLTKRRKRIIQPHYQDVLKIAQSTLRRLQKHVK